MSESLDQALTKAAEAIDGVKDAVVASNIGEEIATVAAKVKEASAGTLNDTADALDEAVDKLKEALGRSDSPQ